MRILIMSDIEGVSGIVVWEQVNQSIRISTVVF